MAAEDSDGTRVVAGRYELRGALGRGGMGVVWRAWDSELDREVAVKEVLVPEQLDPTEREEAHTRVRREARSAARLSDEAGVVTVYDVLDAEGHPWVVMRLVQGRSLDEVLRDDGPLPAHQAARIAEALVRTLRTAHAKGVVHRDIKPGNVMLATDGGVLLTDFGIATVEGETAVTRTGALVGSPTYVAPERLEEAGDTEPASDLWSLGVTLYAAVEGRTPFGRDTLAATLAAVMSGPIPPPRSGGALAPIIMGLLERDPRRRLTADQVLGMLPATAPPDSVAAPPTAPAESRTPAPAPGRTGGRATVPRALLTVAAAVVAVLIVVGTAYWLANRPEASPPYVLHTQEDYSVEYPEDWEVETVGDSTVTRFRHPDETLGMQMTAWTYEPEERPSEEDQVGAHIELRTFVGPTDHDVEYDQTLVDPSVYGTWPESWDVAALEESATVDAEWMEDEDPDWVDRERFAVRLQIHAPDDSRAYVLTWAGPLREREPYDQIISETMSSFRPSI